MFSALGKCILTDWTNTFKRSLQYSLCNSLWNYTTLKFISCRSFISIEVFSSVSCSFIFNQQRGSVSSAAKEECDMWFLLPCLRQSEHVQRALPHSQTSCYKGNKKKTAQLQGDRHGQWHLPQPQSSSITASTWFIQCVGIRTLLDLCVCVGLWDDRSFSPWELCEGNAGFRQDSEELNNRTRTCTQSCLYINMPHILHCVVETC